MNAWIATLPLVALIIHAGPALAEDVAAPKTRVGVLADPCTALEPMPRIVADYLARYAKAKAEKQLPPPVTTDGMAIYQRWQQALLVQDFPGLCRYQAANTQLPPATPHRIVFFGDSITEGWSALDPSFFEGDRVNRGISGQTTTQMVARFRADVINLKPAIVHILAGTNDIAGNTGPTSLDAIENNIRTMVDLAKAHGVRVVLGSVLPAARFDWRPEIQPAETIRTLNARLRAFAAQEGLTYVDYHSSLEDDRHGFKSALAPDGVHPNADGYAAMRPLTEAAIIGLSGTN